MSHNRLDLSSFLLTKSGKVKLGVGNMISGDNQDGLSNTITSEKLSLYEASSLNSSTFLKKMSTNNDADRPEQMAKDIFDLGFIFMTAAVGGFDLLNHENLDNQGTDSCCVLHSVYKNEASMPLRLQ